MKQASRRGWAAPLALEAMAMASAGAEQGPRLRDRPGGPYERASRT